MLISSVFSTFRYLAIVVGLSVVLPVLAAGGAPSQPNIVLIVADDLGYSDLGAYGGEITTPHLDKLANSGVRMTNFHVAPTCSPTRAMLMSGTDNHTAGLGAMAESSPAAMKSRYGYEGRLTNRVATLAERMKAAGYATIMTGKWHLGLTEDSGPFARGFDKGFVLLQGGHSHFGTAGNNANGGFGPVGSVHFSATYQQDGNKAAIPEPFYSSDYFTSQLIDNISKVDVHTPFLAYLAFTAPHSPLQAPAELIKKYCGRYDGGWDALRLERLERMQAMGIIPKDSRAHDLVLDGTDWQSLSAAQRQIESRKMEIYAAMVERMDWNVGRLIDQLKRDGRYDNTLFVFLSDNGPAFETADIYTMLPELTAHIKGFDNALEKMGSADSFVFYGKNWAQAGSAPYRLYKGMVTEGGIRVPAFVSYPHMHRKALISDVYADVMDVLPTLLDVAGIPVRETVNGRKVAAVRGRSMLPYLNREADSVHAPTDAIAFELHGQRMVRQGPWKANLIPLFMGGSGEWELFNMTSDRAERRPVDNPAVLQQLIEQWNRYAQSAQVVH